MFLALMIVALGLWILRVILAFVGPNEALVRILSRVGIEKDTDLWYCSRTIYRWSSLHPYSILVCVVPFLWLWSALTFLQTPMGKSLSYPIVTFFGVVTVFGVLLWIGEIARIRWLVTVLPLRLMNDESRIADEAVEDHSVRDLKNPYQAPQMGPHRL